MNLKPFDLAKALAGAKVVTRDGHPVTEITEFKDAKGQYTLAATAKNNLETFCEDGSYISKAGQRSGYDLFLAPTEVTRWVNVYRGSIDGQFYTAGGLHISKEVAESYIAHTTQDTVYTRENYIATAPIAFEQ